jgi:hypothetical protein
LVVVGFGTRHTLASYLSMQPAPDTTASTGHFVSEKLGGPAAPAAPASSASAAATIPFEMCRMTSPLAVDAPPVRGPDMITVQLEASPGLRLYKHRGVRQLHLCEARKLRKAGRFSPPFRR